MSRVYVGRLPTRCAERDIEKFFKGYGRLRDIVLKNGYGFVEFENYTDADDAVYDLHGRDIRGERIIVEHARLPPGSRGGSRRSGRDNREGRDSGRRYGPPTRTEYRVVVENLSSRVSWQDLKDLMRKAGEVTYADAHKSARNEGIVEFASYSDMKAAIEKFDGHSLYDRRLQVSEDRPRRRSRSDSRGRSRSRSRRGSRRSRGSYHRDASRSVSDNRRKRGSSSGRSVSHRDRSRGSEISHRSKSLSHRSEKSGSRVSDRASAENSRSPSRNVNGSAPKNTKEERSVSRSPRSATRSRSRSVERSRSKSGSRSVKSRSPSQRSYSGEQPQYENEAMANNSAEYNHPDDDEN